MKTLVWVEHDNAEMKDATLAVVTAASKLGDVDLLVAGSGCGAVAEQAAKVAGVGTVHVADDASLANALAENVAGEIRKKILVRSSVEIKDYGSLPRTERKSKRVFDKRNGKV